MTQAHGAFADFDWSKVASLKLQAKAIAEGLYLGVHRSQRRGPGVEFSGHRNYVPGDDLRWLDHHAWLRHSRLLIREFETETDRALHLVVDASASMGYRGRSTHPSKLQYSLLLAAIMARLALSSGDPVTLEWIGGLKDHRYSVFSGKQAFERLVTCMGLIEAGGDLSDDGEATVRALDRLSMRAKAGATVVVFSDLAERPRDIVGCTCALAGQGRSVVLARVLSPDEHGFLFEEPVRLRSLEGEQFADANPVVSRPHYLAELEGENRQFAEQLAHRGARLALLDTAKQPLEEARLLVQTITRTRR